MDPQPPDLPVFKGTRQVRVRGAGRIERDAVIFDGNREHPTFVDAGDMYVVFVFVRKPMGNDIRKQFIQRQIDFKCLTFGSATGLAELAEMITQNIQFGHGVF